MSKVEDMKILRQQIRDGLAKSHPELVRKADQVLNDVDAGKVTRKPKIRGSRTTLIIVDEAKDWPATSVQSPAAAEVLCGHRGMGNRPCIRPADHAEKNHRYGPKPSAETVQQS